MPSTRKSPIGQEFYHRRRKPNEGLIFDVVVGNRA